MNLTKKIVKIKLLETISQINADDKQKNSRNDFHFRSVNLKCL